MPKLRDLKIDNTHLASIRYYLSALLPYLVILIVSQISINWLYFLLFISELRIRVTHHTVSAVIWGAATRICASFLSIIATSVT